MSESLWERIKFSSPSYHSPHRYRYSKREMIINRSINLPCSTGLAASQKKPAGPKEHKVMFIGSFRKTWQMLWKELVGPYMGWCLNRSQISGFSYSQPKPKPPWKRVPRGWKGKVFLQQTNMALERWADITAFNLEQLKMTLSFLGCRLEMKAMLWEHGNKKLLSGYVCAVGRKMHWWARGLSI